MIIKKVWVEIEDEEGQLSNEPMDFDVFIAHVEAVNRASANWDIKRCDNLRKNGAIAENYG